MCSPGPGSWELEPTQGACPGPPYSGEEKTGVPPSGRDRLSEDAQSSSPQFSKLSHRQEKAAFVISVPSPEGQTRCGEAFPINRATRYLSMYVLPPSLHLTRILGFFSRFCMCSLDLHVHGGI
uniref:Uncharacterized protein n=1 Tax=Molossus molossus TaxID=27622 RepID=A0A7J8DTM6_MOLMO|nr:hypothetical protein HJG59_009093 [Molossus molossus]